MVSRVCLKTDRLSLFRQNAIAAQDSCASGAVSEIEETLTLTRLGIRGNLKMTLASTNRCELMIEVVRSHRDRRRESSTTIGTHLSAC